MKAIRVEEPWNADGFDMVRAVLAAADAVPLTAVEQELRLTAAHDAIQEQIGWRGRRDEVRERAQAILDAADAAVRP